LSISKVTLRSLVRSFKTLKRILISDATFPKRYGHVEVVVTKGKDWYMVFISRGSV